MRSGDPISAQNLDGGRDPICEGNLDGAIAYLQET